MKHIKRLAAGIAIAAAAVTATAGTAGAASEYHVGEFQTGPFNIAPPTILSVHYATWRNGTYIINDCNASGGYVQYMPWAGFNSYYCKDVDY